MKKIIAVLLVVAISIGTVFAAVSIDVRFFGLGAEYGLSYEDDQVRAGIEVAAISPVFVLWDYIDYLNHDHGEPYDRSYPKYLYNPSGFSLYLEYDLVPAKVVDLSIGLGLTYVLPTGAIRIFGYWISPVNATLDIDFAINFSEHHAFTARIFCPFTAVASYSSGDSDLEYGAPYGTLIMSSAGYRYTF